MTFLLLAAIVFLAFLVETAVGFGSTVVAVSLAAQLYPLEYLLAVFVPVNLAVSIYLVGRYHQAVATRLLFRRILPLMLIGLAAGIALFQGLDSSRLKPVFGAFVSVLAVIELWRSRRGTAEPVRPLSAGSGAAWLLAGGIVHGVFATGGPMLVYYASREMTDKRVFRATLSSVWLILNLALLLSFFWRGRLSLETAGVSAVLLAPLGLGVVTGEWVHRRMDPDRFRLMVFTLLLAAGVALVAASWSQR